MKTNMVDPQGIIRAKDSETIKNLKATGSEDLAKSDYLEVTGNDAEIASNQHAIHLRAENDDATVVRCHLRLTGKGNGCAIVPKITTAARPAAAAALNGAIYYDTTDNKFYGCANGAWVVIGAQS